MFSGRIELYLKNKAYRHFHNVTNSNIKWEFNDFFFFEGKSEIIHIVKVRVPCFSFRLSDNSGQRRDTKWSERARVLQPWDGCGANN